MRSSLIDSLIQRVSSQHEQEAHNQAVKALQQSVAEEDRLKVEARLVDTGLQVRNLIISHENNRHSRRPAWLGRHVIKMTYKQEPGLTEMLKKIRALEENPVANPDEQKTRIDLARYDFWPTITTPLLFAQPPIIIEDYIVTLGWKFTLRSGTLANCRQPGTPVYPYSRSPLYMYQVAREQSTGEEVKDNRYTMFFDGDRLTHKTNELIAYTEGKADDEATMIANDSYLHALGLMQGAVKSLS